MNDPEGNLFSWTIQCSNGQTNNSLSASNGTKTLILSGLTYATTYTIWVNATDHTGSGLITKRWYTFTTQTTGGNIPPVFGTPTPLNTSTNQPLSLTWSIPINDPQGDPFNWSIQCSNGQSNSSSSASNGTKTLILSGLANSTAYTIWVNATDPTGSNQYTRKWYYFTTQVSSVNHPPELGAPSPANSSTGNLLSFSWSIPITDLEGDTFTWSIQCSNTQTNTATGATNGTKTLALSGLAYATTYTIWVNATDPTGSGEYTRKWYTFTTRQAPVMNVIITKPLEHTLYIQDKEYLPNQLPITTIVYGPINITAEETSGRDLTRIEFYINGKLKATDTDAPYTYLWNPLLSINLNHFSLTHTITVIAYDNTGASASAELNVTRWRFHPLPFLLAGVGIASKFFLHTTLRGVFYDIQQSMFTTTFYAVRVHYSTTGPITQEQGIINYRSCTGGMLIGPMKVKRIGLLHNLGYGSFTVLGAIQ